jgi:hypothetical protein
MHLALRTCLMVLFAVGAMALTGCGTRPPVKTSSAELLTGILLG